MLDMLVDTLSNVSSRAQYHDHYSMVGMTRPQSKSTLAEVLCELAQFLVKHSLVSHAISFLVLVLDAFHRKPVTEMLNELFNLGHE